MLFAEMDVKRNRDYGLGLLIVFLGGSFDTKQEIQSEWLISFDSI